MDETFLLSIGSADRDLLVRACNALGGEEADFMAAMLLCLVDGDVLNDLEA